MKRALKTIVFGILMATSLKSANADLFTNCKSKCAPDRCAEDPKRKAECKKKCPKEIECQNVEDKSLSDDYTYKMAEVTHPKAAKILGPQETLEQKKERLLNESLKKSGLQ